MNIVDLINNIKEIQKEYPAEVGITISLDAKGNVKLKSSKEDL